MNTALRCILFTASLGALLRCHAQTPTWANDIACIAFSHCTSCHHPGGIAGEVLDLTSYTEAHGHRSDIRDYTQAHVMPPWPPHPEYRSFAHERVLTQQEIDLIAAWANDGGPEGDPAATPPVPVYTTEWSIPTPDLSVRMSEFTIPTLTTDLYRCFVIPSGSSVDKWIKKFEVIPGNTAAVHHVLVYQDTTGQALALDAADPEPGYTSFGGIGVSDPKLIGLWVPGAGAYTTPPGMGIKLFAGADIVLQVHYPETSAGLLDSTRVNFQYDPGFFVRNLDISAPLEHFLTLTDGPLIIPPNEIRTFHDQYQIPAALPVTAVSVGPHAHLLCKHMRSFAVTPAQDTIPLIDLDWDFHWQGMYDFRHPLFLPGGTVLHGEATYDNTSANEDNPNDPPQWVTLGEATTDEMMLFYFAYTYGFPADTNTVIDDSPHQAHYLDCAPAHVGIAPASAPADAVVIAPSPATTTLNLTSDRAGDLMILDAQGRLVLHRMIVAGSNIIDVSPLARGTAIAEVRERSGRVIHRSTLVLR